MGHQGKRFSISSSPPSLANNFVLTGSVQCSLLVSSLLLLGLHHLDLVGCVTVISSAREFTVPRSLRQMMKTRSVNVHLFSTGVAWNVRCEYLIVINKSITNVKRLKHLFSSSQLLSKFDTAVLSKPNWTVLAFPVHIECLCGTHTHQLYLWMSCCKPRHAHAVKPELLKSWSMEIDYCRALCLSTVQKTRGLWIQD